MQASPYSINTEITDSLILMIKAKGKPDRGDHDEMDDPVLAMLGVGKEIWEPEPGDRFIERLRSETPADPPVLKRVTS